MMQHLLIFPVVLPLMIGAVLVLGHRWSLPLQRFLSISSVAALFFFSVLIALVADTGELRVYQLSNWPSFAGIVFLADRLTGLMLVLTSVLALAGVVFASHGSDSKGAHFHALFQFQLAGLAGAFLTHDIFNLFVFFEVLLISSYGLLLHGRGDERLKRGMHYVVFNLTASALFLLAVGVLYALVGTLNMADMADKIAAAPAEDAALIRAAALMLLVVFCIKAALLPLYFWLPGAYAVASAPVAALFAIMTKVGVYAVIRVYTLLFGDDAGFASGVAWEWLLQAGAITAVLGGLGALATTSLRSLIGYLVIGSAGFLFVSIGLHNACSLSAALFYLPHTSLTVAALFLLADWVKRYRIHAGDSLAAVDTLQRRSGIGLLFLIAAISAASLPPLPGFFAKVLLLQSVNPQIYGWIWAAIITGGFLSLLALSRAASRLFWQVPESTSKDAAVRAPGMGERAAIALLLSALILITVQADAMAQYAQRTASQLRDTRGYIDSVLGKVPIPSPAKSLQGDQP